MLHSTEKREHASPYMHVRHVSAYMDGTNAGALPDFQSLSLHSKAAAYNVQQWKVVPDKLALCRLNAAITVTLQHICFKFLTVKPWRGAAGNSGK